MNTAIKSTKPVGLSPDYGHISHKPITKSRSIWFDFVILASGRPSGGPDFYNLDT